MASNLPPGVSAGPMFEEQVLHQCPNGHRWYAPMEYELGGWFYLDEESGPYCPTCGAECEGAE